MKYILAFLLLTSACYAQLGNTYEQCAKIYGPMTPEDAYTCSHTKPPKEFQNQARWYYKGWCIEVFWIDELDTPSDYVLIAHPENKGITKEELTVFKTQFGTAEATNDVKKGNGGSIIVKKSNNSYMEIQYSGLSIPYTIEEIILSSPKLQEKIKPQEAKKPPKGQLF